MLVDEIKSEEKLYEKIEQQEKKFASTIADVKEASKTLDEKIKSLNNKAIVKRHELKDKIKAVEDNIALMITDSLEDNAAAIELKELSIQLDILKQQELALSKNIKQTIIVKCKKDIEIVKGLYKEVALQQHILYLMYEKYFNFTAQIRNEINNKVKFVTDKFNPIHSAVSAVSLSCGEDFLKPIVDILFDIDVKEPGIFNDSRSTTHEIISDFYMKEVYPQILPEARKIVEKI